MAKKRKNHICSTKKWKWKCSSSQLSWLGLFVKMGNDAPVIAGKSLTTVESRETFETNQFKVDSLELICWSVIQSVKATAWSETLIPLQVVVPQQVPRIHCFWSSSCGFPDVSHTGWYPADILQLQLKAAVSCQCITENSTVLDGQPLTGTPSLKRLSDTEHMTFKIHKLLFWPHLVSSRPWSLTFWPQHLICVSLSSSTAPM